VSEYKDPEPITFEFQHSPRTKNQLILWHYQLRG